MLAEAVAAVDGPVSTREERDFGALAALCAGDGVHFAGPVTTAVTVGGAIAAAPAGTPVRATAGTALGFVCVALFGVVLLIVRSERERAVAVHTGQGLVLITHDGLLSIEFGKGPTI